MPPEITVLATADLDAGPSSVELQGKDHGGPGVSLILVDAPPGGGPSLHRHDYAEVIIMREGTATFTDGVTSREVGAGHVVLIPAGVPHGFTNTGQGPLSQIDIHASDAFVTDWLG